MTLLILGNFPAKGGFMAEDQSARMLRVERARERAREHPLRITLLDLLRDDELSAPELRSRLSEQAPLSTVAYHLRVLQEAEMVDVVGGLYRLA
jgi:DNA-binding transcriptional ArsR family regulator